MITWPWSWPLTYFFLVRDMAIIFGTSAVLNKSVLLLSLIWNTWPLISIFDMSITDENTSNPSCSMPSALITATYNDYFSNLLFTNSLSSPSKEIQYRAIRALCYFAIIHIKWHIRMSPPIGVTCITWNAY